ncbi:MAG TPA: creatininase family protein [Roseiarcus sp.]|jgi:creatinine amidohydrolase/Fe(II)-dependent formamide hydrolase-like protein
MNTQGLARAARLLLLPLLILNFAPFAYSQARPSVFLEDLTWTELRDEIGAGKTTIIVPIGGTEQNGPAMALGKHNRRVKLLSERIALALGDAIIAPVIAYVPEGSISPPSGHMRFPGTISVPEVAFEAILEGSARSFKLHGFKDIVFLGDHGGTQADERTVTNTLNREWASSNVRAHAVTQYYEAAQIDFGRILKDQGFTPSEIGTHAGLNDTSLMLALDPSLVREDRLSGGAKFGASDGVYGDPSKASAKLGMLGVDAIVSRTVAAIKAAVSQR